MTPAQLIVLKGLSGEDDAQAAVTSDARKRGAAWRSCFQHGWIGVNQSGHLALTPAGRTALNDAFVEIAAPRCGCGNFVIPQGMDFHPAPEIPELAMPPDTVVECPLCGERTVHAVLRIKVVLRKTKVPSIALVPAARE